MASRHTGRRGRSSAGSKVLGFGRFSIYRLAWEGGRRNGDFPSWLEVASDTRLAGDGRRGLAVLYGIQALSLGFPMKHAIEVLHGEVWCFEVWLFGYGGWLM